MALQREPHFCDVKQVEDSPFVERVGIKNTPNDFAKGTTFSRRKTRRKFSFCGKGWKKNTHDGLTKGATFLRGKTRRRFFFCGKGWKKDTHDGLTKGTQLYDVKQYQDSPFVERVLFLDLSQSSIMSLGKGLPVGTIRFCKSTWPVLWEGRLYQYFPRFSQIWNLSQGFWGSNTEGGL